MRGGGGGGAGGSGGAGPVAGSAAGAGAGAGQGPGGFVPNWASKRAVEDAETAREKLVDGKFSLRKFFNLTRRRGQIANGRRLGGR